MARLICPQCGTKFPQREGVAPVCPNCNYTAGVAQAPAAAPAVPPPQPVQPSPPGSGNPYAGGGYSATPYGGTPQSMPPPGQPYQQGQPVQRRPTNGLCVTSMVLGIIGFCTLVIPVVALVALILGIVGKKQAKQRNEEGDGYAVAGIVLGAVSLGLWLVWLIIQLILFAEVRGLRDVVII